MNPLLLAGEEAIAGAGAAEAGGAGAAGRGAAGAAEAGGAESGGARAASGAANASRAAAVAQPSAAANGSGFWSQTKASLAQQAPYLIQQKLAAVEQRTASPSSLFKTPIDKWLPSFAHTIFVGVSGGPQATLRGIWLLALATAFGRLRARKVGSIGSVSIDGIWDITDKSVGIRLGYEANGLGSATQQSGEDGKLRPIQMFLKGPSAETTGGDWPDFLPNAVPKALEKRASIRAMGGRLTPQKTLTEDTEADVERKLQLQAENYAEFAILPDDGRIITTANKRNPDAQPPKPPTTDILSLVSSALLSPCYFVEIPATSRQAQDPNVPPIYPPQERVTELRGRLEEIVSRNGDELETTQERELRSGESTFLDLDGYPTDGNETGDDWFGE